MIRFAILPTLAAYVAIAAAPGVEIQTIDLNGGYIVINGTSAAAAHLAVYEELA